MHDEIGDVRNDIITPYQTREHILRECPRYEEHRDILRKSSHDIPLPEILGTPKGIIALTEFLRKTGAFTATGEPRSKRPMPTFEDTPGEPEVKEDEEEGGDPTPFRWQDEG